MKTQAWLPVMISGNRIPGFYAITPILFNGSERVVGLGGTLAGSYQTIDVGGGKVGGTATGLIGGTSGYQDVDVGSAKVGGTATGLANDATVYTASILVDGVAKPITVTGSAAQTYTTLLAEINTDLGISATAGLSGGDIRVTSAAGGASSTVAITDTNLFSTLTGFVAVLAAVPGVSGTTVYTAVAVVDGVSIPISVAGADAQTYTALLAALNADLGVMATAALNGGNIRITAASTSILSTIAITDTNLFSSLTGFVAVNAATAGTGYGTYVARQQPNTAVLAAQKDVPDVEADFMVAVPNHADEVSGTYKDLGSYVDLKQVMPTSLWINAPSGSHRRNTDGILLGALKYGHATAIAVTAPTAPTADAGTLTVRLNAPFNNVQGGLSYFDFNWVSVFNARFPNSEPAFIQIDGEPPAGFIVSILQAGPVVINQPTQNTIRISKAVSNATITAGDYVFDFIINDRLGNIVSIALTVTVVDP